MYPPPPQIGELESEDGKKDTMVDVVFKKALKEFRINIFNSYSTALAVSTSGGVLGSICFVSCLVGMWSTRVKEFTIRNDPVGEGALGDETLRMDRYV